MWDSYASRGVISASSLIFNDDFKCRPNEKKERTNFNHSLQNVFQSRMPNKGTEIHFELWKLFFFPKMLVL